MAEQRFDAIIIGGGPAGLTAALYLGRARKTVLVIDRGNPRHAISEGVHNFLTRDGMPPAALRITAWEQMAAYPSVVRHQASVASLEREDDVWIAGLKEGERVEGRAVLLATGVVDEHPDIPGYRERWGHSIHHCPYCHGWEMRDQPLAVLASGKAAGHLAPLLRGWSSDVVLLTHGKPLPPEDRAPLTDAGIQSFDAPVVRLEGPGHQLERIVLADGTVLQRSGLFVAAAQHQVPLVEASGVRLNDEGYVDIDPLGATSLPMVWAAGDLTSRYQQVIEAAAQGGRAGAMINAALTLSH